MLLMPRWDEHSPLPHYVQLYETIKQEISSGQLAVGSRLPSIRKLADLLAISTTPVELAYQQLIAEGFIESKPKRGYYVQHLPEPYMRLGEEKRETNAASDHLLWSGRRYRYDFHVSKNDFRVFPFRTWRRLFQRVLHPDSKELLFYGDPQGELGLRQEIARYLYHFRGVKCSPEQIVVGAEQHLLLSFLAQILKSYATGIGVENPGYPLVSSTFRQRGYDVVPIALEEDGLSVEELYKHDVQLAYVSPSHQYPQGMMLPIGKRLQLLEWAEKVDGFVIEDDYDGEFRYQGRPIPSLQGLLPDSRVIYLGGFSQSLAPALCINYMVLPAILLDDFRRFYWETLFEQSSSPLHQQTLQLFMQEGHWERHVRKMRNIYRRKHDRLVASIQDHFQERGHIIGRGAGFHLLLRVDSPKPEAALLQEAKDAGIRIASAAYTWHVPTERKEFIFGFGGIDIDDIDPGIASLHQVWFS
ncbi:MocR-like pyridoxine biosynthesis transcription factor PdxR [Brevibacillus migulae]|uniref:MocR-like pyridoxine biosynthesis transcription factor PdxR n=1 Tax=Brevibacillus migulae TaxID=1644114 RepID=UPI00106EB21B|nr:PLP-dependent aminotransferase family protein [Brevibacillus migulae]